MEEEIPLQDKPTDFNGNERKSVFASQFAPFRPFCPFAKGGGIVRQSKGEYYSNESKVTRGGKVKTVFVS